ncbi:hypothetical protein LOD99_1223 [Oopsacas minuta]|uniref:C2H2-type domain-containing protein n=1 Tax=Oopsacas minuta TaxID=111878 RepID=A0AAV7K5A1_9METZ|nr:hypothetical protein LOD99_1223 [Oopsacas minuta]
MSDKDFLSSFRHHIPEAEEFLLVRLNKEFLSNECKSVLYEIQEKLICLTQSSSQSSSDQILDLENYTIITPPADFQDNLTCNADNIGPIVPLSVNGDSDSQPSDFTLHLDSDSTSNNSQTALGIKIPPKTKTFKRITIKRKRQKTADESAHKKTKIVISSEEDSGNISYSPIGLNDDNIVYLSPTHTEQPIEDVIDYITPPIEFNQSPGSPVTSENEDSSSYSSITSSSSGSPQLKNTADSVEDVVDLYVRPEEAFPSSDNNTPDTDINQPCEVYTGSVGEKRSLKSRLGVRPENSHTEQSDCIEVRPSTKFKVSFDKVIQQSIERPIKCYDCHEDIPVIRKQLKCRHCYCKYSNMMELENHVIESEVRCIYCKLTFNTGCELNLHMARHPKLRLCDSCSSVRKHRSEEKSIYLDSLHTADGSYVCQICSVRCKTISELNIHSDKHSKHTDSPLLLESIQVIPERHILQPIPKLVRDDDLEPNSELQLSKDDAAREFSFLRQRNSL